MSSKVRNAIDPPQHRNVRLPQEHARFPLNEGEQAVIDFNRTRDCFERIADGIERLIDVFVPKEAPQPEPRVPMLTPQEAAKRLRVNVQTVMKWCRQGEQATYQMCAAKLGNKWIIPADAVDAVIRKCQKIHGRAGVGK
jgi:excisionase family DNA binding protein